MILTDISGCTGGRGSMIAARPCMLRLAKALSHRYNKQHFIIRVPPGDAHSPLPCCCNGPMSPERTFNHDGSPADFNVFKKTIAIYMSGT